MTKDPDESENLAKTSKRFLNSIITNRDFNKINHGLKNEEELIHILEKIKNNLSDRIFSVDVSKRKSKKIDAILNKVYDDLKNEKKNNENFINELQKIKKKESNVKIDFSGSSILNDEKKFYIPPELKRSPFFNLEKFENDNERKRQAQQIIEEAKDVSSIR